MITNTTKLAAIRALEEKYGRVWAEDMVEESRNPSHPLHTEFLWNNEAKAAHEYRLDVARTLINSVRVEITRGKVKISTIGYVRDPNTDKGYISIDHVRTEQETCAEVLDTEVSRIRAIVERARGIATALSLEVELQNILNATFVVEEALGGKRMRPTHKEDRPQA
jgi:hypothetical protein